MRAHQLLLYAPDANTHLLLALTAGNQSAMITLSSTSQRLQACRARQNAAGSSRVPSSCRPVSRRQILRQRRLIAAAAGRDFDDDTIASSGGGTPGRFDDRSTPDTPDMSTPSLKEQQVLRTSAEDRPNS